MIVLGSRRVDFLVTQFANGVTDDDCQEVLVGKDGPDANVLGREERERRLKGSKVEVEVDVSFLVDGSGGDGVNAGQASAVFSARERRNSKL